MTTGKVKAVGLVSDIDGDETGDATGDVGGGVFSEGWLSSPWPVPFTNQVTDFLTKCLVPLPARGSRGGTLVIRRVTPFPGARLSFVVGRRESFQRQRSRTKKNNFIIAVIAVAKGE